MEVTLNKNEKNETINNNKNFNNARWSEHIT